MLLAVQIKNSLVLSILSLLMSNDNASFEIISPLHMSGVWIFLTCGITVIANSPLDCIIQVFKSNLCFVYIIVLGVKG